ncbi:MAG TPA: hypothetical protein VMT04_09465 [Terriglobales bacterium]|nr:hypothetical protein [Terriglobales bacterium]
MSFRKLCLAVFLAAILTLMFSPSLIASVSQVKIGNVNGDTLGSVTVSDVVYMVNFLFKGGPGFIQFPPNPPLPPPIIPLIGDANFDGKATVSDVVYLVNYLFKGGPQPGNGGKSRVYGYITYTHLKGGVPGTKVWTTSVPDTISNPLDTMAQSLYVTRGIPAGLDTMHAKHMADPYSSEPTDTITVPPYSIVQRNLALYPTTSLVIDASLPVSVCGDVGTTYPNGLPDSLLHWKRDCRKIELRGETWIANGQTLTIDPGVIVYCHKQDPITDLVIQQGAKIIADGTPYMPIIMTSEGDSLGNRYSGDWGGLMLAGYAQNNMGCNWSEGNAAWFGTNCAPPCVSHPVDNHDNSGILRYFISEFAGYWYWVNNELNGIALYCVGDGTVLDHIQVHRAYDDGIEMFGGAENMKYILCSENNDDEFDYTDGYAAKAQFVFLRHYGGKYPYLPCCNNGAAGQFGDHMIEGDNQETNFDKGPVRSNPILLNFTAVGPKMVHRPFAADSSFNRTEGHLLRHGTNFKLYNSIMLGGKADGIRFWKSGWQAWDTAGYGASPGYWPYGKIRRDSVDVAYDLWYNNGDNGIAHFHDDHAKIGGPWYAPPHSALCDTIQFDAVMLCDTGLPHNGAADPWKLRGYYQDTKYMHHPTADSGTVSRGMLIDDGTGIYNPKLWRPGQATEVDGRMDARPLPGSPALSPSNALPPGDPVYSDPFFHYVPYVGAFGQCDSTNHVNDWTWPWAEFPDK